MSTPESMLRAAPVGLEPLHGGRVTLTRCAPGHAGFMRRCYQDAEFMDLYRLSQRRDENEEQIVARLAEEQKQLPQQRRSLEWVISRNHDDPGAEGKAIGLGAVVDYIHQHQRAEFMVGILDPQDLQGGIALESTLLIMEFAFNVLQLNKLTSYVYAYNESSEHNTEELGFTREGFLREHIYHPKKGHIDLYLNGMLASDFRASQRLSRLSRRLLKRDITRPPPTVKVHSKAEREALKESLLEHLRAS